VSEDERRRVLVIACGALAHEISELKRLNDWTHLDVQCLPAQLHNRPERIPEAVENKVLAYRERYEQIFIGYADCGTGGRLDAITMKYGLRRIPGAHCYEFFAGASKFHELAEREPGTFYLTDYLARNFNRLIVSGMGMDRHPELKQMLFGNYRKLVYLAQTQSAELDRLAREAAALLDLEFERVDTGLEPFGSELQQLV
jgi:hypothetical protein